ncbi:hypothetical protein [Rhizobium leguminosarum]|uniref:hypothetical protein n=1 Tax=Rhizobium leguminosarum TaxID=384 RepID=UPI003F9697ED
MNILRFLALAILLLSSCESNYGLARTGISPILNRSDVSLSATNQRAIVSALAYDAGYTNSGKTNWYAAAAYGFNYVDDQCRTYFDDLFSAEKDLQAAKSGVSVVGQTTNAILTATGASKLTMGVVAQAFGLTSNLLDVTGSSFLYRLPAAPTKEFVGSLQNAYRDAVARRSDQLTEPEVYYHVQRYLDLCLPATIEGRITKYIGAAQAFPDDPRNAAGGSFDITVESQKTSAPRTVQIVTSAKTPLAQQDKQNTSIKNAANELEKGISVSELVRIQRALCVTPDADWGPSGSNTRTRIVQYLTATAPDTLDKTNPELLTFLGRAKLHELADDNSKKCGQPLSKGN